MTAKKNLTNLPKKSVGAKKPGDKKALGAKKSGEVRVGRAMKAQSDMSSKAAQQLDGIAQNLK